MRQLQQYHTITAVATRCCRFGSIRQAAMIVVPGRSRKAAKKMEEQEPFTNMKNATDLAEPSSLGRYSVFFLRRRAAPAIPASPVARSVIVAGSGVAVNCASKFRSYPC